MIAILFMCVSLAMAWVGAGILFTRRSTHWGFGLMAAADVVAIVLALMYVRDVLWPLAVDVASLLIVLWGWFYVASVERAR